MWITKLRLTAEIQFHNTLYGFPTGRGTRNASFEAKLIQQLMTMREEVLYDIFLDIHKAYCSLYRDLCLDIFASYGV